jgi:hypothetical protein
MSSGAAGYESRLFGMVLGFAGALLDFYSGYLLLTHAGMERPGMGAITENGASGPVWGVGIVALGAVLAVTTLATVSSMGTRKRELGALMLVYGAAMLFIGASMYEGITSMGQGSLFPASGMFLVGALMVANGAMMRRSAM